MHFVAHPNHKETAQQKQFRIQGKKCLICYVEGCLLLCNNGFFFVSELIHVWQNPKQCWPVILLWMWISPWLPRYVRPVSSFSHLYPPSKAQWCNIKAKMFIHFIGSVTQYRLISASVPRFNIQRFRARCDKCPDYQMRFLAASVRTSLVEKAISGL